MRTRDKAAICIKVKAHKAYIAVARIARPVKVRYGVVTPDGVVYVEESAALKEWRTSK